MDTIRKHKWILKGLIIISSLALILGAVAPYILR